MIKKIFISLLLATTIVGQKEDKITNYEANKKWSMVEVIQGTPIGIYSYNNMEEFLRTSVIDNNQRVVNLEYKENNSILDVEIDGITFREHLDSKGKLASFMLVEDGKIAFEKYITTERNDNRIWMSTTKTIAGLGVAILEDRGEINVFDTIEKYMPSLVGTDWEGITIINILNMATGLDIAETRESRLNPDAYISKIFNSINNPGEESYQELIFNSKKRIDQGLVYEYSSVCTQMLGLLIEEVSGMKIADFVEKNIWSKIGTESYAKLNLAEDGTGLIIGIFSSRLVDMAKYAMIFTPSWNVVSEEEIVTKEILERIYERTDSEAFYAGSRGQGFAKDIKGEPVGSSYQFDQVFANGDLFKLGLNGQGIYISPVNNIVAVWHSDGFPEDIQTEAYIHKYSRELHEEIN